MRVLWRIVQGPDFLYFVNLGHKTTLRELAIQSLVYRSRILESVEFFSQFETGASPCNLILNQDLNKWFEMGQKYFDADFTYQFLYTKDPLVVPLACQHFW